MAKNEMIKNDTATLTPESLPEFTEIVGVSFKTAGKVYYFDPCGNKVSLGTPVIVETARGIEMGYIKISNKEVPTSEITLPLRPVIRVATENDIARVEENRRLEGEAKK